MEEKKIERQDPWISEEAIKLLDIFLKNNPGARVMETGMGFSTLWLEKRCRFINSIEHDKDWYYKTLELLIGYAYITPSITASDDVSTTHANLRLHPTPYHIIIETFPDNFYDLLLIDGRNRVKCIKAAIPKLRSGGWLVLDNSEREYYQPGIDLMKDWNRIDCRQQRPDKYGFTYPDWTTSIFIKP